MKYFKILALIAVLQILISCNDFLDVAPDKIATIDNAFADRNQAEKYLFTLYSFVPQAGHPETNPAFNAGDEFWIYWPISNEDFWRLDPYNIARGLQNKVSPYMNYWNGYDRPSLWEGIRDCNIFLEKVEEVSDLDPSERNRWVAEAKFLKGYLHWYLFRMYGPIPIMDENLPVSVSPVDAQIPRQSVDSVVNYILGLYEEVLEEENGLPNLIANRATELGRITRPAVLALKARLLVTAASPLFNGNGDYLNFNNRLGENLFNPVYDSSKWVMAAEACKEAIDASIASGIKLYGFNPDIGNYDSITRIEMNIRNAVCEKWNSGEIWASTIKANSTDNLQLYACPQLDPENTSLSLKGQLAPTMKMAELFYSKNGVPIEEDKTYDYDNRFDLRTVTEEDSLLQLGYRTVGLHFDREPRFYADLGFDGGKWFMRNKTWDINNRIGQPQARRQSRLYSITGYYCKKVVNWEMVIQSNGVTLEHYPWPLIRLADLYLLYAESLNEINKSGESIEWIDKIRSRAGLRGVVESWNKYSNDPNKYLSQKGLREIIHQERLIEMAFEGSRFWDLRRWKEADKELNAPIYGWGIDEETAEAYYQRRLLFNQRFQAPRDYFWPIQENSLIINTELIQNPGW